MAKEEKEESKKEEPKETVKKPGKVKKAAVKPAAAVTKKRKRRGGFNKILILGVIIAIGLFGWAEQQRRSTEKRLIETEAQLEEIKVSTTRDGQEVAAQVLEKVRSHIDLPAEPEPTVATIVDVERLRETSTFYEKAENGDHLIITAERAILYDPETDRILDVVPVRINQDQEGEGTETSPDPNATPDASPTPTGSPANTQSPEPASGATDANNTDTDTTTGQ